MVAMSSFPWRIFTRIILVQGLLILTALTASGLTARYFFSKHFIIQIERQLRETLTTLSHEIPRDIPAAYDDSWCLIHTQNTSLRLTIIEASSGKPRCDSRYPAARMSSLHERDEVQAALRKGFGVSTRFSTTNQAEMFYGALFLNERNLVLRAGIPLENYNETMTLFDRSLAAILTTIGVSLFAVMIWSSRQLTSPLGRILQKSREATGHIDSSSGAAFQSEFSELESSIDNISRNLTLERKEHATIMGAISEAIIALDTKAKPLFYNSHFLMAFGNPDDLASRHPNVWKVFEQTLTLERPYFAQNIAVESTNRESPTRYFSVAASPLTEVDGSHYGVVGVFHDITELKSAEKLRLDFIANASHELRTPLTAIKGYTDTIIYDIKCGRSVDEKFLQIIARNSARLLQLINDLLDLSSLESQSSSIEKQKISTQELTQRVTHTLQNALDAKGQTLESNFEATEVWANGTRAEQVLTNLVYNAIKYIQNGGHIRVSWENAGSEAVILKVTDNGPGIPKEHHARLFERFYRVDKGRSRETGGTGLGLSIVKHIMQSHGGEIRLESEAGQGSTFSCSFPNAKS